MKGLRLNLLRADLNKVSPRYKKPIYAIRNIDSKFRGKLQKIRECFDGFSSFYHDCHKLPLGDFRGFTVDELCKIKYSSVFTMHKTVNEYFETNYQHEVIRKIWSSMHQWSSADNTWNEIVDAYESIRRFDFGSYPGFEVRLDYSTYNNRKGFSKYSRTFLDGVFAFLVYYNKQHVMTIGFSIVQGKKILLQQVQLVQRRKNRFLYKLPKNRIEFVIDLFYRNFSEYQLYLVDGANLVENILIEYQEGLNKLVEAHKHYKECIKEAKGEIRKHYKRLILEYEDTIVVQNNRILHLTNDCERLQKYYSNTGKYVLNKEACIKKHGLSHYKVSY